MITHSKPWMLAQDADAAAEITRTGWLVGGPAREAARRAITSATGAQASFLFPSGRVALASALRALDLPAGAGVVVQAYACDAVVWAIRSAGLKPVLCDLQDGWTCGPDSVGEVLSPEVAALILAPPFGLFQSAAPFRGFGLPIIHDLCQANPAILANRWADAGDLVTLSFHPTKYAGAAGGGAVLGGQGTHHRRLELLEAEWSRSAPVGDLTAALIVNQIGRIPMIQTRRAQVAAAFKASLPAAWTGPFSAQADVDDGDLFRFPMRIDGLDFGRARALCEARGVAVRRGVDAILSDAGLHSFPKAEAALGSSLSLPFYPALSDGEVEQILAAAALI